MTWHDRLQKAQFKGKDIFVRAVHRTSGRRVPVRRLAGQDESVQQDLGLEPTQYEITAFFWGDSYDLRRDELEAELVKPGAGKLVLPTRGEILARVIDGPYTDENKDELGYVTVRFTVVAEPRASQPSAAKVFGTAKAKTNTSAELKTVAAAAQAAATADTAAKINIRGLPSQVVKSTLEAITKVTDTLKDVQREVQSQLSVIDDFSTAIAEIEATANSLLSTPSALATKLTAVVLGVFGLPDTVERALGRNDGVFANLAQTIAEEVTDRAKSPHELATPARVTQTAVKAFSLINQGETISNGTSVGPGTVGPAAVSRVDAKSTGAAASAALRASGSNYSGSFANASSTSTLGGGYAKSVAVSAAINSMIAAPSRTKLPVTTQEEVNTRTIYANTRVLAVARAAETFSTATFDSSSLALQTLQTVSDVIDELQSYSDSDTVFSALSELRSALANHLTAVAVELPSTLTFAPTGVITMASERAGKTAATVSLGQSGDPLDVTTRSSTPRSGGLPRVVEYDPPREVPALLIAHEFYGDSKLETDIVARNRLRHPLFVSDPIEMIEPG